jgi:hypothetical protein
VAIPASDRAIRNILTSHDHNSVVDVLAAAGSK